MDSFGEATAAHLSESRLVLCAHIFFSVGERHASVQSAVLEAPQETVIHQNVQDGRHLTEDENLENNDHVTR